MIRIGPAMRIRTYSELRTLRTFEERFNYLALHGSVGIITFGLDRFLNQDFYTSGLWRSARDEVIVRDGACDLAIKGYDIFDAIRIHHMNPMLLQDLVDGDPAILDPEFLICTSLNTHNAIHFGTARTLTRLPIERRKGDTKLW